MRFVKRSFKENRFQKISNSKGKQSREKTDSTKSNKERADKKRFDNTKSVKEKSSRTRFGGEINPQKNNVQRKNLKKYFKKNEN